VERRVSSAELIGRGPELAALLEAVGGEFSAVFLAGESGVGKSRLLDELARRSASLGARVLDGECVMLGEGELPYAPIRSALRRLGSELAPEALAELLGAGRDELARLVPQLGGPRAAAAHASWLGSPVARARLFELLLGVLTRIADDAPVLLVVEDIHWADRSTLDFLGFLIAGARSERLLLVCSYRTDELHQRHPLRAFLAQHEQRLRVRRVDLRPFTRGELEAQLRGILGATPDPDLADRLYCRSEGNAFFTEELLAAAG
jgi:predicted ATPase